MWKLHTDVLDYHRSLVADGTRTEAFRAALAHRVRPGSVVADVGAGTGLLSILACQAGARRVYAMDQGHIAAVAGVLIADNALTDRIVIIRASSLSVKLPEPVDVIVSETLWNAGIGEGIVLTMRDACQRFLKPEGTLIPSGFDIIAAPMDAPEQYAHVSGWAPRLDVDFRSLRRMAANNVYRAWLDPDGALAPAETLTHVALGANTPDSVGGRSEFIIKKAGTCHGFGVWFRADLADGVDLSNAPGGTARSWKQAFFPLDASPEVEPGDLLRFHLTCADNEMRFDWLAQWTRPSENVSRTWQHSTLAGFATGLPQGPDDA